MSVKDNGKDRVYLCLNIFVFLFIGGVIFFYNKIAFTETNTGVYYRKLESGNGKSIIERIKELKEEAVKDNSKSGNKNEDDVRYILKVERCVSYKGKVIEYPNQGTNQIYTYDYLSTVDNNYMGDYYECLNMLKNMGDRYIFKIKLKNAYLPMRLDTNDDQYVLIELKLVDVFSSKNFYQKQIEHFQHIIRRYYERNNLDKEIIMRYLENIGRNYHNTGDYFVILDDPGRGERIKIGDKVKYNYCFKLHGENILDTNIKKIAEDNGIYDNKKQYKPLEATIKEKDYSPLKSFVFLKKGSNGIIFYPFKDMSYIGAPGFFELYVEIIDVKHEEKPVNDVKKDKKINETEGETNINSNKKEANIKEVGKIKNKENRKIKKNKDNKNT